MRYRAQTGQGAGLRLSPSFALDTQQLREQVTNGVLGEIYVTTARALRRCGVPGWGVFTNKELQVVAR